MPIDPIFPLLPVSHRAGRSRRGFPQHREATTSYELENLAVGKTARVSVRSREITDEGKRKGNLLVEDLEWILAVDFIGGQRQYTRRDEGSPHRVLVRHLSDATHRSIRVLHEARTKRDRAAIHVDFAHAPLRR